MRICYWTRNIRSIYHLEQYNNISFYYFYSYRQLQNEISQDLLFCVFQGVLLVISITIHMIGVVDFHPESMLVLNSMIHCQKASISIFFVSEEKNDRIPIRNIFFLLGRVYQLKLYRNQYLSLDSNTVSESNRSWKAKKMKLKANNICIAGNATELTQL